VLLLDELPEFPRSVLESLRQPLDDGIVAVAHARGHAVFPATSSSSARSSFDSAALLFAPIPVVVSG
jgi:hypothetical protein